MALGSQDPHAICTGQKVTRPASAPDGSRTPVVQDGLCLGHIAAQREASGALGPPRPILLWLPGERGLWANVCSPALGSFRAASSGPAQTWWPPGSSDFTSGYVLCGSTVGHFPGAQNFPSFGCSWPKLYQARPSLDPGGVEAELVPYPAWDSDFILHSF